MSMTTTPQFSSAATQPAPEDTSAEDAVVSAHCVLVATATGEQVASVVIGYAVRPGDGDLLVRGMLSAGWALVAPPIPHFVQDPAGPALVVLVDQGGVLQVRDRSGEALFVGEPQRPVRWRWLTAARTQPVVPVMIGVWGVDLGNEVDLTGCARAGKLVAAHGVLRDRP